MTIDEHHEAITQTIELMAIEQREAAKRISKLTESVAALTTLVSRIGGGISDLIIGSRSRETRIFRLENMA